MEASSEVEAAKRKVFLTERAKGALRAEASQAVASLKDLQVKVRGMRIVRIGRS